MIDRSGKLAILAALLMIAAALALWWRYGLVIVLAEPGWLCLPR